ncbi:MULTISPECIES: acyl carrier protein [Pseudomonas syringae group]|uniref:acyl carrier protein n=1 Tax=Pseudomonas syringae group TaxID=136849 RepID=UPI0006D5EBD9|nr:MULTISPECIES: acyl carrier protein [Pseudomonas syringae group]KPW36314.1 Coronamic acid synthetase CmaD [Pseudomonas coronafaciens pv. atropurpurea]MCF5712773.1 acyl carrier protein [Pseudomonas tremae]MCF5746844.1 acyl carrier protein [Pseudomonas tremae]RMP28803.1 Coronamic acid synthetase CmaD [Pseudomonas coronafaciens pv. atropurpurea]RMT61714.1 Coronamic acid synthetase CmaD [Pseudomonas coronafaciens pv. atropurpurea]
MSSAKLDQIFEAIFQRPVENDEDIFDLGANSLTAIQLIGQVNEAFGANINMEQFFLTPCKQTVLAQLQVAPAADKA